MDNKGYILIWRKIETSGLLQTPNTLALFIHLLLKATHQDIKVGTPNGIVELKRGQYISGRHQLSTDLKQSEREIRTGLERLVNLDIISIKSTNRYSIYTIEKYSEYQNPASKTTNRRPAGDQQATTKQTYNTQETHKYIPPIPAELLSEWMVHRKRKPVTERVYNSLVKEAKKLGWTAEQAVIYSCENSWQGFKASWVKLEEKQQANIKDWI